MIDEVQPTGPSGLLNLIKATAQGATPNPQPTPFGSLAMPQQLQTEREIQAEIDAALTSGVMAAIDRPAVVCWKAPQ